MVFKPLADWKVWLLSTGMIEEKYEQLLGGCLVVGRKSDWTTRPTWCHVLYQDWTSSIMTNWSCHCSTISSRHCTILWWVMRPNCYWISPSLSPSIYQVSITLFSSHDPFNYALSFSLSHYDICVELEADYRSYESPAIAHKQAKHSAHKPIDRINQWLVHHVLYCAT